MSSQKLQVEIDKLKRENEQQRRDIDRLVAEIKAKEAEHGDKVELAHQAAKAMLSKIRAFDIPDSEARAWFESRGHGWYTFSRAHAHPDMMAMMARIAGPDIPELYQALSEFVTLEEPGRPLPDKLLGQKRAPELLLHAMLANFICRKVICSPFWFLEEIPLDDDQLALPAQISMDNLYQYLISLHKSDAHQWRSSLARILAVNGLDQPIPTSFGKLPFPGTSATSP